MKGKGEVRPELKGLFQAVSPDEEGLPGGVTPVVYLFTREKDNLGFCLPGFLCMKDSTGKPWKSL